MYVLTTPLPTISQNLIINGNGATVERSTATGTPAFVILTVSGGTLSLHKLSFTNGDGAISVTGSGNLSVNGGTFSQNQAPQGGAIDIDGGTSNGHPSPAPLSPAIRQREPAGWAVPSTTGTSPTRP